MKVLKNQLSPTNHHLNTSSLEFKEGKMKGRKVVHVPTDGVKSGTYEDQMGFLMLFGVMTLGALVLIFGILGIVGNVISRK